jgi:hypothetical protein
MVRAEGNHEYHTELRVGTGCGLMVGGNKDNMDYCD